MSDPTWLAALAREVADTDPLIVGIGIGLSALGSAYCGLRAWHGLHKARTIEDIPTAKARSAPQGYVELEGAGRLMDGPPIVAPLSGLPCVWFRYRIEEQVTTEHRGHTQTRWQTVARGESTEVFWLEDDTGRVAVDPEGADVTPKHKDVWQSRSMTGGINYPATITNFLTTHPGPNPYRFTEVRINPGDRLYALGMLKNVASYINQPTLDEEVRELLRVWKQDQADLKQRFDLNRDGNIDQQEWMLARAAARREAQKTRRETQMQFTDGINLLSRPADTRRPYILSAYPQKHLVKRYRSAAALYGTGFFLLGIAAVWLFNTRFRF
jgi:hypothetical protein